MGALETIDWEKLDSELYSVIAHASAGTDFTNPDLQMAVDGCIEEMKHALKASAPCVHEWTDGMFSRICKKCGLVDDA